MRFYVLGSHHASHALEAIQHTTPYRFSRESREALQTDHLLNEDKKLDFFLGGGGGVLSSMPI